MGRTRGGVRGWKGIGRGRCEPACCAAARQAPVRISRDCGLDRYKHFYALLPLSCSNDSSSLSLTSIIIYAFITIHYMFSSSSTVANVLCGSLKTGAWRAIGGSRSLRLGTNGIPRTIPPHKSPYSAPEILPPGINHPRAEIHSTTSHSLKLAKLMRWDKMHSCVRSVLLEQKKWVVRFGPCCGPSEPHSNRLTLQTPNLSHRAALQVSDRLILPIPEIPPPPSSGITICIDSRSPCGSVLRSR